VFGCKCYIYKKCHHLRKFQRRCAIRFLLSYSSKSKAYRVFNHATILVEETYDVEFDETNGSQGALENLDDVGDEPLRETIMNMPIRAIKSNKDDDEVQVTDIPYSSNIPQNDEKMRGMQIKIHLYLKNTRWYKPKMLMLHNHLPKWLTKELHPYYNHIHTISSLEDLQKGLLLDHKKMFYLLNITFLFLVLSLLV
jgi:hypothetical protein